MGKTCYKNMGVTAHGHTSYATSVTFNETATLQQIKTLGAANDITVLTNIPKGTCEYSTIMTQASDISSLTGRIGKTSKKSPTSISAGALSAPPDNRMTSMSVEAAAGGVITIKSSNAFDGTTSFGGTPSTPTAVTVQPLLAANIELTLDGSLYTGVENFSWTTAQSFKESQVVGSVYPKQELADGTITLSIASDAADVDYDIVTITGAGGICPSGAGEDTRHFYVYSVNILDCSGNSVYNIQNSGALEGRGTSASPGSPTKTTLTFVNKFPNELFPDQTEDCS